MLLIAAGLAACASKQPASVENVANGSPTPAKHAPVASRAQVTLTSPQLQACNSAAPFTVRAANKTTTSTDVCAAFERALANSVKTVTFNPGGVFQVDVTLADVQVRRGPNTRFITCKVTIGLGTNGQLLAQANGGATIDALQLATRDCLEAVIENLLTRQIAQQMQQHVASTTAGGVAPQSSGSATTPSPSP